MMKYDFINIKEANIYGVNNSRFIVIGTIMLEEYKFIVRADGVEIPFDLRPCDDETFFYLETKLSKGVKKITLSLELDGEEVLVCERKNNVHIRLKSKYRKTIKNLIIKMKVALMKIKEVFITIGKAIRLLWREHHFIVPISMWGFYWQKLINKSNDIRVGNPFYEIHNQSDYNNWLIENEETIIEKEFEYNPLISILIPVYNIKKAYLSECLDSVLAQTYSNFEICIADDCSTKQETLDTLKKYAEKDSRIRIHYRKENGHISKATNDALAMAKGEFIALMDNDDLLTKNALYENVKVLNQDRMLDMLYSDEDKVDLKGKLCEPHFKPDFSPDTLLSVNYICHFTVLRKSIVDEIGGFRVGYEGAQDYDLFLRFTEKTNKIYHIDKILYHWKMIKGSTATTIDNKAYAIDKGVLSITDALQRRGLSATVRVHEKAPYYLVEYDNVKEEKISIIIPTRDYADILEQCLISVYDKTKYTNFEVIIVNNNSTKKETFTLFNKYKEKYSNFKVIDANFEFNYSKLNNLAISQCDGEYIVLLNNDTEIISPNWLNVMVGYASQPHIGAVGAKLFYPDKTIQHGGVVLGIGGVAGHAFLGCGPKDLGLYGRLAVPYNYGAVTAACLMVSKQKFWEVNGLEEQLMVAFNDIDFNMRLLEKGYYNLFAPQVELYHHESKSRGLDTTGEKYKRFLTECDFMYKRWGDKLKKDKCYNRNLSLEKCFALDKEIK